ncbi:purine permease [Bacillus sp. FJAT-42376]|uniref:nucleobase:cation symporter-2 family protein n=1 Tax=Bacillus sp. FJAT-42376 TaxID=2014076 RepID=UPI000F4EF4D3|nr:nucleobase:cation symporter-2 family protein [Bacillus sp. FJAT-42376]AZB43284.1 purine permease [Bacillus sp. FJAT-42376]
MKLTAGKTASLAIQHVLAMYAGAMIVPLIVGSSLGLSSQQLTYLVSIDIFMCGIATLLQIMTNRFFGIGLPIVLGCTFTAVGPMIAIGNDYSISAVYGAILASGLFVLLFAGVFSKIAKFFPPVVTGSVVTIIGITLIPVAMGNMAGGEGSKDFGSAENLGLAFGVLLMIIILFRFTKGFIRSISILIGLAAGTVASVFMGKVDFQAVQEASWVSGLKPFYFGTPSFEWAPILTMILVAIVSMIESTGVYAAVGDISGKKIGEKELAKGYRAEGLAYLLGGIFNAFPYTAYSQNVGLIQLSGVKKRRIIAASGVMLAVLGLVPKIAAFTTIIPAPVLGGAMVAMFGMVIAYGIKMLSRVDFSSQENLLIIACSVGIGMGVTAVPDMFNKLPEMFKILTGNGIVAGSLAAILLNLLLNVRQGIIRKEPLDAGMVNDSKAS